MNKLRLRCNVCGKKYIAKTRRQRFCSVVCSNIFFDELYKAVGARQKYYKNYYRVVIKKDQKRVEARRERAKISSRKRNSKGLSQTEWIAKQRKLLTSKTT